MGVISYRDLLVWQKAMNLVEDCYRISQEFPRHQQFGLTGQLQRAAVSSPANIAEGYGRQVSGDYLRFLSIARGSLTELETHIQIVNRLSYLGDLETEKLLKATTEIGRMLTSLFSSLKRRKSAAKLDPNS